MKISGLKQKKSITKPKINLPAVRLRRPQLSRGKIALLIVCLALTAACCNVGILSDMVNIGTLSAFTLVAISIPIMRKKRPDLERSFKIPGNPWVPILIAIANLWLMVNLSVLTWIRFVVWLIVGFAIYFGYGYRHARLGAGELEVAAQE